MSFESLPVLLLAIVVSMIVVALRRSHRTGTAGTRPSADAPDGAGRRGPRGVVDSSIGMWILRRLRDGAAPTADDDRVPPDFDQLAYRIGVPGVPRPAPPTRMVAVHPPRPRFTQPVPPEAPADVRLRLWRDTVVGVAAIGLVVLVGNAVRPPVSGGEVLAETFAPSPTQGVPATPPRDVTPVPSGVDAGPSVSISPDDPSPSAGPGGGAPTPRPRATRSPKPLPTPESPSPGPSESPSPGPTPTPGPSESPSPGPSESASPGPSESASPGPTPTPPEPPP